MIKIENCPDWAALLLRNHKLYGVSAWSLLWANKFGPMVEPFFKESDFNDPAKNIRSFKPYGLSIDDCYAVMDKSGDVFLKGNPKHLWELEEGILRFSSLSIDRIRIQLIKSLFPALSVNGDPGENVLSSPCEVQQDAKSSQKFRQKSHDISPEDFKKVRKVYEWHLNAHPSHEWVEMPEIDFHHYDTTTQDCWGASDVVFRGWLLGQLEKYTLSSPDVSPDFKRIMEAQQCDGKGSHQGWSTHLHSVLSTLFLDTSDLSHELLAPLRVAMLLHDLGKNNPKRMFFGRSIHYIGITHR